MLAKEILILMSPKKTKKYITICFARGRKKLSELDVGRTWNM